jgi:hypothetical protein
MYEEGVFKGLLLPGNKKIKTPEKIQVVIDWYEEEVFFAISNCFQELIFQAVENHLYDGILHDNHCERFMIKSNSAYCLEYLIKIASKHAHWIFYLWKAGILTNNAKFLLYSRNFDMECFFLTIDRSNFKRYQQLIAESCGDADARSFELVIQAEMKLNHTDSLIQLNNELGDEKTEFHHRLDKKEVGLSKNNFFNYLLYEKGFNPFKVNLLAVSAKTQPHKDYYIQLIEGGVNSFEVYYYGFNLLSLLIHYQCDAATNALIGLLLYYSSFPERLHNVLSKNITAFPDHSDDPTAYWSTCSYPEMMRSYKVSQGEIPVSTLLDIALMRFCPNTIHLLVALGLQLGNTSNERLKNELDSIHKLAVDGKQEDHVFPLAKRKKMIKSSNSKPETLNLLFIYQSLVRAKIMQPYVGIEYRTLCSFIMLSSSKDIGIKTVQQSAIADSLSRFDATAHDIFSESQRNRQQLLSDSAAEELFGNSIPNEIVDIITNQMLGSFWYVPLIIGETVNNLSIKSQQDQSCWSKVKYRLGFY